MTVTVVILKIHFLPTGKDGIAAEKIRPVFTHTSRTNTPMLQITVSQKHLFFSLKNMELLQNFFPQEKMDLLRKR